MHNSDPVKFVLAVICIAIAEKLIEFTAPNTQITVIFGGPLSITFNSLVLLVALEYFLRKMSQPTSRKPYTKHIPSNEI